MADKKEVWQDKGMFLSANFETHTVNGTEYKFFPVSVNVMFRMRTMAKPLATALRTLFSDTLTADRGRTVRQVPNAAEEFLAPVSAEIARLRAEQADKAISDLVEAFTDEKNATVVGELLVDSLRETFGRGSMSPSDCLSWFKGMDVETLSGMLVGLGKGNKKLLGPFGEILSQTLGRFAAQVEKVAAQLKVLPGGAQESQTAS